MRKLILIVVGLLTLAGCKKSSFVAKFDETPEVRIGKEMAKVKDMLSTSPSGWVATTPTGDGGGYSFHMSFDATENVTMYADMNDVTSTKSIASYYRIKQDAGVDLVFDTYCYLTWLNDPDPSTFGGNAKTGFKSDVDFIYQRSTPDSIFFLGKRYRQPLTLVKATAAQKASYAAGELKTAMDKFKSFFATTANPYIEIVSGANTTKVGIAINSTNNVANGKRISFGNSPADTFVGEGASLEKFAFTLNGASILNKGLVFQGISFVRLAWKDATTLAVYDSTGKEYIIKTSASPVVYSSVTVADATTDPNWGSEFVTRRATASTATMNAGNNIKIGKFKFTFSPATKKMDLNVSISIGGNAGYTDGIFTFAYNKNADGTFKFSTGAISGNGSFLRMDAITTERLAIDTFKLTYFTDPVTSAKLGKFQSVEHPDFSFTGTLQ